MKPANSAFVTVVSMPFLGPATKRRTGEDVAGGGGGQFYPAHPIWHQPPSPSSCPNTNPTHHPGWRTCHARERATRHRHTHYGHGGSGPGVGGTHDALTTRRTERGKGQGDGCYVDILGPKAAAAGPGCLPGRTWPVAKGRCPPPRGPDTEQ